MTRCGMNLQHQQCYCKANMTWYTTHLYYEKAELGRIALPERKIRIFTPNFGARKDFQYFFQGAQKYLERK